MQSYDSVFDRLENGRQIEILIIVDEYHAGVLRDPRAHSVRGGIRVSGSEPLFSEPGAPWEFT